MAATYTIGSSGKFLTSALNPIRQSSSSQDRMVRVRGLPKMKINTSYPPQIEATRYKVVSYRSFCQSVHFPPGERMKSFKPLKLGWACVTPVTRITSYAMSKPLWSGSKWLATKTTDSSKGGPVKSSGGGLGRVDAMSQRGFYHRSNASKLEKMKRTIEEKPAKEKTEEPKPDPFESYNDRTD